MIYGLGADIVLQLSERAWESLEEALVFRGWAKDPESVRVEIHDLVNEIRALRQKLAKLPGSAYAAPTVSNTVCDLI